MNVLIFLLIGIVAGWIASLIMMGSGAGILIDMLIGIVGAVLGGMIFDSMGLVAYGLWGSLIVSTVGSIVFLAIVRMFRGPAHRPSL